ncbi:DUF308 domain-containing protein [Weissella ceti]|uniref:DUF308 domain-containing protein n=1 Tax=Weissella ceti TaxID=759620 RepID=A0ABT3E5T6_9LACO|nr:DUF308 domain-containing protein [Weissella ceti]MCW0953582.1 DUF308 domain-containing protein [Weissella ceti]QVK12197.1 DUF308 domain-containing protein [Weissella ceti]
MNFLTDNNNTATYADGQPALLNDLTRKLFFAAGMIAIVLGIFAFTFSTKGLATMSALFAVYTLFLAVLDMMLFTKSQALRGSFLVSALLSFVMGLTMLFRQDVTNEFLGLVFGFWVLFNAISILSQVWLPELLNNWYRFAGIAIGLIGILMGMYLTIFPNVAPNTQSIILGIFADLLGIYYLLVALFSAKKSGTFK